MVPIFSYGPGAQEFTGIIENTDVFVKMKNLLID
jgi:alkaline phosphatase